MKTGIILAAALAFSTAPALAQTQQPAQTAPQAQAQQPRVQTVSIVDFTELPAETQAQVKQIEEQRTDEDLAKLQKSIEDSLPLLQALEEKGVTAADVVAASLSQDGALTIVTRKES